MEVTIYNNSTKKVSVSEYKDKEDNKVVEVLISESEGDRYGNS